MLSKLFMITLLAIYPIWNLFFRIIWKFYLHKAAQCAMSAQLFNVTRICYHLRSHSRAGSLQFGQLSGLRVCNSGHLCASAVLSQSEPRRHWANGWNCDRSVSAVLTVSRCAQGIGSVWGMGIKDGEWRWPTAPNMWKILVALLALIGLAASAQWVVMLFDWQLSQFVLFFRFSDSRETGNATWLPIRLNVSFFMQLE